MTAELLLAGPLAKFALGYLAVLAAPGPNMLAVGALAALRGVRGVLPFCLGIAAGAGALTFALWLASGAMAETPGLEAAGRAVGGVILLLVAARVMGTPRPRLPAGGSLPADQPEEAPVAFGAGFLTAATNPVTAAYGLAQFLGPLGATEAAWLAAPVVAGLALAFGIAVAAIFGRPGARRLALAHHRVVCLASGAAMTVLAVLMLRPLFSA